MAKSKKQNKNLESIANQIVELFSTSDPNYKKIEPRMYSLGIIEHNLIMEYGPYPDFKKLEEDVKKLYDEVCEKHIIFNEKLPLIANSIYSYVLEKDYIDQFYKLYHKVYKDYFVKNYPEELEKFNNIDSEIKMRGDDLLISVLAYIEVYDVCERYKAVRIKDDFKKTIDAIRLNLSNAISYIANYNRYRDE